MFSAAAAAAEGALVFSAAASTRCGLAPPKTERSADEGSGLERRFLPVGVSWDLLERCPASRGSVGGAAQLPQHEKNENRRLQANKAKHADCCETCRLEAQRKE